MKRTVILFLLAITISMTGFGQSNNSAQAGRDRKEVVTLRADLYKSYIDWDAAAAERSIIDDNEETDPLHDTIFTKAQNIEQLKHPRGAYLEILVSYTATNTKVKLYGDTAILTEDQVLKYKDSIGKISTEGINFMLVAVKRKGHWWIVSKAEMPDINYENAQKYKASLNKRTKKGPPRR